MYDAIAIEDAGKPAVAMVNKDFITDSRSAASGRGRPGIRVVSETVPTENLAPEVTEKGITPVIDDIVAALTKPLTEEEKSPTAKEVDKAGSIVFGGSLAEVNQYFYKRGWTDGLPIVPPTTEAVREMMTGTDLPADHVVGRIIPRLGKATVERIAINAVMAGALPTYMPVLIACVQCLTDPTTRFGTCEVSTGSWSPFWIINGPIRNDLHVNNGTGALSPGNIANAAIGRAMGLIIKNIGGARKAIEDMGTLGNPAKYSMVISENEEESPWQPLHVEQGLARGDSAVSVYFPNNYLQVGLYGTDDSGILRTITSSLVPRARGLTALIITPRHARTLHEKGWSKKEIAAFISEYARRPAYHHPGYYRAFYHPFYRLSDEHISCLNPMDSVPILDNPDWIKIVVAGGAGFFVGIVQGGWAAVGGDAGSEPPGVKWKTQKVELPANWDKLVKKYKDMVPTHVRY